MTELLIEWSDEKYYYIAPDFKCPICSKNVSVHIDKVRSSRQLMTLGLNMFVNCNYGHHEWSFVNDEFDGYGINLKNSYKLTQSTPLGKLAQRFK
jgi:hypothetical protein